MGPTNRSDRHDPAAVERLLLDLLLGSYRMHPDRIPAVTRDAAIALGGTAPELWLVDLDQRRLAALDSDGREARVTGVVPIDGSAAGLAFRSVAPVTERNAVGTRLWLPLLDSAERLGVLGVTLDQVDERSLHRFQALASFVGELIANKQQYGDAIALARRSQETTLAAEMRWGLLPPLTFVSPEVTVAGILEPAYEIAGDTFDYAVNGRGLHFAIIDAMGHGLEASRLANVAVASYRHSRRAAKSLQDTVRELDAVIADQFGASIFVTGQFARLDLDEGVVKLVNVAHPPPLHLPVGGGTTELECTPCVPAGLGSQPLIEATYELAPGDMVMLHTDGITESRDGAGEEFGTERLVALTDQLRDEGLRPSELARRIVHEVLEFTEGPLRDDATLLIAGWELDDSASVPRQPVAWRAAASSGEGGSTR